MPAYDYKCEDCGWVWESARPMAKRHDPAVCPNCGSDAGKLASFTKAPHLLWYPGATRKPFYEPRRNH